MYILNNGNITLKQADGLENNINNNIHCGN